MRNSSAISLTLLGLAAAWWKIHRDRKGRPVVTATIPAETILSDLPTEAVNLYYLTKPPSMIIPVRPFRADNRSFPKPHRYRDPQGPLADIYNPTLRSN